VISALLLNQVSVVRNKGPHREIMKFWYVTPCNLVEIYKCLKATNPQSSYKR